MGFCRALTSSKRKNAKKACRRGRAPAGGEEVPKAKRGYVRRKTNQSEAASSGPQISEQASVSALYLAKGYFLLKCIAAICKILTATFATCSGMPQYVFT